MKEKKSDLTIHIAIVALLMTVIGALVGIAYYSGGVAEKVNSNTDIISDMDVRLDVIGTNVTRILTIIEQAEKEEAKQCRGDSNEKSNSSTQDFSREESASKCPCGYRLNDTCNSTVVKHKQSSNSNSSEFCFNGSCGYTCNVCGYTI